MSIWSDIQDRSAGVKLRREDMMTIEELTEIMNEELQQEQNELLEPLKDYYNKYFKMFQ